VPASCTIGFVPWNSTDTTVLGTQFFFNYGVVFDYDDSTITFQENSDAPKGTKLYTPSDGWEIALLCILGIALICIAVFSLLKCRKKQDEGEAVTQEEKH